jgi:hypothetical protein
VPEFGIDGGGGEPETTAGGGGQVETGGGGGGVDGRGWHGFSQAEHIVHCIWSLETPVMFDVVDEK